ncbi:PREDICTED: uncharacterized protein LOC107066745 [Polistes dominula]|uniref:Uncharacterized protein LOC107066745 n=1 Tax=Polistes dominula TaxID=743375 RepID=A0ABM1IAB8_POLDO|nr:PREDICTED: uncharacterized protein LOC107066745 [Polistes dominula]
MNYLTLKINRKMLSVIIRNAVKRINVRNFSSSVTCNNVISGRMLYESKELLPFLTSPKNLTIYRNYYNENNKEKGDQVSLPQLIPGPINTTFSVPKVFKVPFMQLFVRFITKDPEFELPILLTNTKKAASIVSIALANQDYDSLYNLVDNNLLNLLKTRIDTLSDEQRKLIAMNEENITLFMAYDLKFRRIYNTEEKKRVELTLVGHYIPGFNVHEFFDQKVKDRLERLLILKKQKTFVCNYVFSRDYCDDLESHWIIKHINHSEVLLLQ